MQALAHETHGHQAGLWVGLAGVLGDDCRAKVKLRRPLEAQTPLANIGFVFGRVEFDTHGQIVITKAWRQADCYYIDASPLCQLARQNQPAIQLIAISALLTSARAERRDIFMIATTTTQPTPFVWNEIALSEVVLIDGAPTTRRAIGEWLEYADPQKSVDKILERNTHIQIHGIPVKLTGMGGARDYENRGLSPHRFPADRDGVRASPRAHEMKAAVAEFVWALLHRTG